MAAKRMPLRQPRMIKVLGWIMRHSQPLHHMPGTDVGGGCKRNDFREPERLEAEGNGNTRRFGRIAATPVGTIEPPAHLDRGRERCRERRNIQTDEADKVCDPNPLNGPESEAMFIEERLDPVDEPVRLGSAEG